MIVTVSANAALDITYSVPELAWNAAQRVEAVHRQAGGKGLNVARVLTAMGIETLAVALVGGLTGAWIRDDLELARIPHELVEARGESRFTVVARAADGRSIELDEPGMEVTSGEWASLASRLESRLRPGVVAALSGSLPRGVSDDAYRRLVELSVEAGAHVILDASGPALAEALPAGPDVVKPNLTELETLIGETCDSPGAVLEGCRRLLDLGARAVVASLGERGAVAVEGQNAWWLTHPLRQGNPVGAGDALVAGMAAALETGDSFLAAAHNGVLWASASLASPFAGWLDPAEVRAQRNAIEISPVAPETARPIPKEAIGR